MSAPEGPEPTKTRRARPEDTVSGRYGPRILFKTDAQSSIGRGAVLFWEHFRPHMAVIIECVGRACQQQQIGDEVTVTEGWRKIRPQRDCHEERAAFDFTIEEDDVRIPFDHYRIVANVVKHMLGPKYDVIVHGEGMNLHIHIEFDPKPTTLRTVMQPSRPGGGAGNAA